MTNTENSHYNRRNIFDDAGETIKEPESTPVEDREGRDTISVEIEADDTQETS